MYVGIPDPRLGPVQLASAYYSSLAYGIYNGHTISDSGPANRVLRPEARPKRQAERESENAIACLLCKGHSR